MIHRPFYLNPKKKRVFALSAQKSYFLWEKFSSQFGLPWSQHGTIEVAIDDSSLPTLDQSRGWALENGMVEGKDFEILDSQGVKKLEPEVTALEQFTQRLIHLSTMASFRDFCLNWRGKMGYNSSEGLG